MSLDSTAVIKAKLAATLGEHAPAYFGALRSFLSARTSRAEFEAAARQHLDSIALVQLHNTLIISLFDPSTHKVAALTPPPDAAHARARKRRRVLPYQGPDDDAGDLRAARLKHWVVGVGRRERERVRALGAAAAEAPPKPLGGERAVALLPERRDPAGSRPSVPLGAAARGFTLGAVTDRINLICAQHDLPAPPSRAVASLLVHAFEAKLKALIIEALAMTASSHAIPSVQPSAPHSAGTSLRAAAFDTLFTVAPASVPHGSAAAARLTSGELDLVGDLGAAREPDEPLWQMRALLAERSGVEG